MKGSQTVTEQADLGPAGFDVEKARKSATEAYIPATEWPMRALDEIDRLNARLEAEEERVRFYRNENESSCERANAMGDLYKETAAKLVSTEGQLDVANTLLGNATMNEMKLGFRVKELECDLARLNAGWSREPEARVKVLTEALGFYASLRLENEHLGRRVDLGERARAALASDKEGTP